MTMTQNKVADLVDRCANKEPLEILGISLETFSPNIALSFSGAEDVVLIDLALKTGRSFEVFSLDTGRLHPETYGFIETVRTHYGIPITVYSPEASAVERLVREKGLFSFYRDGHGECCGIRKVEPLKRALRGRDAWVTGQRSDQSPATRADLAVVQLDRTLGSDEHPLVKFNPIARWSSRDVWEYIRRNDVPYNVLHERGFVSIGCEPCTRPVLPAQHEREGRWWWEEAQQKECGLHRSDAPGVHSPTHGRARR